MAGVVDISAGKLSKAKSSYEISFMLGLKRLRYCFLDNCQAFVRGDVVVSLSSQFTLEYVSIGNIAYLGNQT